MKKILASILALCLVLSTMGTVVFATDGATTTYEVGAGKLYSNLNAALAQAKTDGATNVEYHIYGAVEVETSSQHGDFDFNNATVVGMGDNAQVTVIGGGVSDITNVNMKDLTFADHGTYLTTANEFMYQNFAGNCTFTNVKFIDGIRLGTSEFGTQAAASFTNCVFEGQTENEYLVWFDNGEFEMTNCNLTADGSAYGIVKTETTTLNVTGSTFTYTDDCTSVKPVFNFGDNVNVTITGNTFHSGRNDTFTVKSGTINGVDASKVDDVEKAVASVNITTEDAVFVAKIGDTHYTTLKSAINAAQTGNTITLIADVTGDVTVNKSITIDGANKQYTGTMALDASNITIQNLKIVGGKISKGKNTASSANITIQGCSFDGQGLSDYALNLRLTNKIVIEDCTAENYGFGLLQVPASNNSVSVKNVTISNVNYGLKIDYSNGVTLENVKINDAKVAGILDSNYGKKTYTIKNCTITGDTPLDIWERENSVIYDTFMFVGENNLGTAEFTPSNYAILKLAGADATLKACSDLNITSDTENYSVMYADGTYSIERVAEVDGTQYASLQEAITAGGNITLLKDVTEDITIADNANIELNLNGKTLNGYIAPCKPTSLTVRNGSIVNINSTKSGIEVNTGELTLTDVNIDSARHAVRIDGAVTAVINGGTYKVGGTANATQYAVNVSGSADVTINDGTFTGPRGTASDSGAAVKVQAGSNVTINDGTFTGGKNNTLSAEGTLTVNGGFYDQNPEAFLANGYTTNVNTQGLYKVVKAELLNETLYVDFVEAENNTDEGYIIYNVNVKAADSKVINRLNSVDLTFDFDTQDKMAYEVIKVDDITVTTDADYAHRYMFNFNGKDDVEDTANYITVAQIKVTGYGTFDLAVDADETNVANATKTYDNLVDTFLSKGAVVGQGVLDISDKIEGQTINVPKRTLTVNVTFPNAVVNNTADIQKMSVTISGADFYKEYELGDDTVGNAAYTVEEAGLTLNNTYTVTVKGEGYRTARYTVTMTDAKTLNFWNNVMDNAIEVEEGKASSADVKNFLAGDIVADNEINIYDLSAVVSYFTQSSIANAKYIKYDLNRDGVIDSKDVAYVLVSWGE